MIRLAIVFMSLILASAGWAQEEPPAMGSGEARVEAATALEKANSLASKGKYADAVGYYERALKLDPVGSELAYYNLAEVQKVRGNCRGAVLTLQMYANVIATDAARKEAAEGVKACKAEAWPKLELKVEPANGAEVFINGILAGNDGVFGPLPVPVGTYDVRFTAPDHHPVSREIDVKEADLSVVEQLKKMTFFGTITVKTEVEGARIRVFEGPSDATEQLHDGKSPMKEGVKVREGRHFVEVTAEGYNRWIRNVAVGRDIDVVVDVELHRSLPVEIQ